MKYGLLFILFLKVQPGIGQSRIIVSLNEVWEFTKDIHVTGTGTVPASVNWETIHLPHTWNTADVMDDEPGYYRGTGWYRKKLNITGTDKGKQLFLRFEGANQLTEVYINGRKAGTHIGGYTAFQFAVSSLLYFDGQSNEILVKVDNSYDPQVPPLTADFTFFGGLYRDAWLIKTGPVHFNLENSGSDGLFISTPRVNKESATIHINGSVTNTKNEAQNVKISTSIFDKTGKQIDHIQTTVTLDPRSEKTFSQDIPSFAKPRLWSPDDPYLYRVRSTITETRSGRLLDEITSSLGFRWFHFDADKGFFLNGKPYKLVGASRHQDRPGMGNAVPDELARQDISLLKKMGGNFLRVAHYPQDPSVMEACDRLGILASVEIPVVNEITESDSFYKRCDTMLVEMIRQQYNHPCVIMWGYMNEVLLRPHYNDDKVRQKIYFSNIVKLAKRLDSIARREDPYRYTLIANHGDFDRYYNTGLTAIPMVVGWNLYSGWYGGQMKDFPAFLDKHHQQLPAKPMVVSEYGADADPRIRSFRPVKFDKSVEYSLRFHQYYLQEMLKRPFVSAAMIWNLADFNSETREETMPHINNKGLLMWDRTPKDLYYFYQAVLTSSPFLKIASSYLNSRSGAADSGAAFCYQPLQLASNLDSVELIVNGKTQGWKKPEQGLCEWTIPFVNGKNIVTAKGMQKTRSYSDNTTINFRLQPYLLNDTVIPFEELNVLLGADRYFFDKENGRLWQPSQSYHTGSWGHINGQIFKMKGNTRLPYGSDKNILGTADDPVYQTQLTGISGYRLDVPAGEYELTLHFAELQGGIDKSVLYNLSDSVKKQENPHRRFTISLNGKLLLENFDIAAQYGIATAVIKKFKVIVKDEQGIQLEFKSLEGEPVLNAIQVRKIN
ncbi:MAG TPA: glycoside hydrolase family 2 TIM barrel-domain containing protein [Chitinophagaceae bacterium]|nr:glycoside hydrolase family 2 TIM barrel-domain containing protein [Chitinophagaceae bacterium]